MKIKKSFSLKILFFFAVLLSLILKFHFQLKEEERINSEVLALEKEILEEAKKYSYSSSYIFGIGKSFGIKNELSNKAKNRLAKKMIPHLNGSRDYCFYPIFSDLGNISLPYILEALGKENYLERKKLLIFMLGNSVKERNDLVTTKFISFLKSKDVEIRLATLKALDYIKNLDEAFLPFLFKLLKDPNGAIRSRSVFLLGKFGKKAKFAMPEILGLINNLDIFVVKDVWPGDDYVEEVSYIFMGISNFGGEAEKAIPLLVKILADNRWKSIDENYRAGGYVKRPKCGHDHSYFYDPRSDIILTLTKINTKEKEVVSLLKKFLNHSSLQLRSFAYSAISTIEDKNKNKHKR